MKKIKLVKNTKKINKEYDGFINERCSVCGKEMHKVSDILVSVGTDEYICRACQRKYMIQCYECASPYSEEEI